MDPVIPSLAADFHCRKDDALATPLSFPEGINTFLLALPAFVAMINCPPRFVSLLKT
jgi:hypothetical protein